MSYLFQFLFMILLTVFACGKVTLQSKVCRNHLHGTRDSVFFNGLFFASVLIFLMIIFHPTVYTGYTLLFGALVGASTVLFQCTYTIALSCGPVSLTVMITGFSILISTIASIVMFNETVSVFQIIGIVLLIASLILTTLEKGAAKNINLKWVILSLTAMLANGFGATMQKTYSQLFAYSEKGDTSTSFLIVIYAAATLFSFLLLLFLKSPDGHKFEFKHASPFALAMGLIISIYQRLYMVGLANIDGVFFFPMSSGLSSLSMTLIGIFLFRDKLTKNQWIGTACGLVSVCLMNVR